MLTGIAARGTSGGSYRATYIPHRSGVSTMKSWTAAAAGAVLACACHSSSARPDPGAAGHDPGSTPAARQPETTGPIDIDLPQPASGPRVGALPKLRNV